MLVDASGNSRNAAEEQKRELREQEASIIQDIISHSGTMKSKIQAWAEVLEKLRELLDVDFEINQISTYITHKLIENHCPGATHVRSYLPDKYKNQNMIRAEKVGENLITAFSDPLDRKPIEQYSNLELEFEFEYLGKTDNDNDKLLMLLDNRKEDILREGMRRGIQIGGEKLRDQISCKDYRYEIPEYFGLKELNEEVPTQLHRWIKALVVFADQKWPGRPAHRRQDAWKYANSIRVMANIQEIVNEDKWSGELEHWFDREYWAKIQSKHDAGNSTMFPTTLCANCSKDVAENPKDCVRMKYWRPSPTGYICDGCGGTQILERENTREQVGDKEADVFRDAADVLNHIPWYADVFIDYVKRSKSPEVYGRKAAISGEFSKSAIGGVDKMVVPRKK